MSGPSRARTAEHGRNRETPMLLLVAILWLVFVLAILPAGLIAIVELMARVEGN